MRLISHPVLCNYYVTYRCNASCSFCDIWERPSPYVTLDSVKVNLIALKRLGVKVIDFTGGEPLLHREIDQILTLAKELGFITTLTTNCLLYPKLANRLKGKIDMLHFSLDAANKAAHDASRGVACFDFVIESIRIALSQNEKPDILFTVTERNVGELVSIYEKITLPNQLLLIINPVFSYNEIETAAELSPETLKYLSLFSKKPLVYINDAFLSLRKDKGNRISNPVCKAASSTIVISPEDHLMLPCYHLGIESFPISGNLYDLYSSAKVQQLIRLEGRYPACEGCTINCYMQPSFAVEMNKYWWKALPSTIKYNRIKGTWKKMLF